MPPHVPLQFLILLPFSIPVRCQFEFNNQQIVYDVLTDLFHTHRITCVAILRPPSENPQEKFVIDWLTYQLAKTPLYDSEKEYRKIRVMSYTTDLYQKYYMDPSMRERDSCYFWNTVVMVNNSTNEQLAHLSESYTFDDSFWIVFLNRSELANFFQKVHIRLSTGILVVQDKRNGILKIGIMGRSGKTIINLLWNKKDGYTTNQIGSVVREFTINVGILEPFVMVTRNKSNHIIAVTGFYGDIWNDLQEIIHFKSVFVESEDKSIGSYDANGNWTGLYSLIVKKQADIILNSLTVSKELYHIVDYLDPIEKTKYKLFYHKDADRFDWLKVFRPLHYPVWIALIIWVIVGGAAVHIMTKSEFFFQKPHQHFSLISCFYFVLRTLCCQGSEQVPKLWALRIFFLTAYVTASIILASYSASLVSVLTVKTPVEPFQELNDILETDFKLSIESNSTDFDFFEKTTDTIHREIYQKSVVKEENIDYQSAIEKACKNSRVLFFGTLNEVTAAYIHGFVPCALLPLQSDISPAYKSMAVAKHSEFYGILRSRLFQMIEKGLVNRYKRLYLPDPYEQFSENDIGIGLLDVGAIFIYFSMFIALSASILGLEIFFWKYYH